VRPNTAMVVNYPNRLALFEHHLTLVRCPLDPRSNCFHLWVLTNNTYYAQAVICINWTRAQVWPSLNIKQK